MASGSGSAMGAPHTCVSRQDALWAVGVAVGAWGIHWLRGLPPWAPGSLYRNTSCRPCSATSGPDWPLTVLSRAPVSPDSRPHSPELQQLPPSPSPPASGTQLPIPRPGARCPRLLPDIRTPGAPTLSCLDPRPLGPATTTGGPRPGHGEVAG